MNNEDSRILQFVFCQVYYRFLQLMIHLAGRTRNNKIRNKKKKEITWGIVVKNK